ncbi:MULTISPECIES: sigma-54 interaction domain-containing protein [Priestia]|uniref:sigma-54 interaction domain-containing protein n=1 Tax=Priestia TaxID=2800373 RepID=UPI000BF70A1E|nr:sigma-54-dependent Fis family transcriptional regulator [Priestia megaterium]MDH6652537.1 PAS domain S-box-containing protein [Bacillus sp. PvP124]MDD9794085.1 sigma-54-dependent Fis family transcriptional regulator [Priestia megaterium]MDF2054027.1 sigma-54-dependent Fis family transcriptional regulator [Priestia megaterium]MDF2061343.1 sigma-54-dependent Fis family transcriptional regulator [Priestia megaterium]PFP10724.1 sigma-54-dependent Fis family transcriptional regulator [Priestia m
MQNVLIVGGGKGGLAILKILLETEFMKVIGVVDVRANAPAVLHAQEQDISTGMNWEPYMTKQLDVIVETTGKQGVFQQLQRSKPANALVVPGLVAEIMANLMEEKEELIQRLKQESYKYDLIFNAAHDAMVVIDRNGYITLFNQSAERLTNFSHRDVIGKHLHKVIPNSKLVDVLHTKTIDQNSEFVLDSGRKVITTRIPILDENGELFGAFSIFKDITDVVGLAEEVTNLKEVQTMLQAIIQSSEEAISVVDEEGRGILINPAYTRITGLKKTDIIGQPATADISEGDSMHMKVLQTRRPVRGVRMRLGPSKRDVVVNVAPVIVDGKLKGSVGVIHDMSEIQELTNELKRARQIIRTLEAKYSFADIIGQSEEFQLAIEQARLAAKTPATVLLRGESGTGKELFAHAIHNASSRKFNKFVRINCAALSESLLESELFGYEEGAFSGAKRGGKRGVFEEANNGSIFLDEIGELSAHMQAKLLRVLQEKELIRVGGTTPIPVNVRVIAATNVNLEKGMADGSIRQDLYYRLNKIPIHIPPLRKRKEDIGALVTHLITKINQDYGRHVEGVTERALQSLRSYDWPGNVRELENILGRAIIYMHYTETMIDSVHLPSLEGKGNKEKNQVNEEVMFEGKTLAHMMENYEAELIQKVLLANEYNRTKTAKQLNISLRSLYYKLEKYNLANNSMQ